MTTYRVNHDRSNPYVRLNKAFLESPDLSAKAKGLLAYLLSRPDNWRICLGHLVKVFSDGEASIRSGLKELSDAGYLVKAQIRDRLGRIKGWRTDVFEFAAKDIDRSGCVSSLEKNNKANSKRKQQQQKDLEPKRQNPDLDYPDVAYPDVDFQHLENRGVINNDLLKNEFNNSPLTPHAEDIDREREEISFSQTCSAEANICSTSLVETKIDREDRSSAPMLNNQSTSDDVINETSQCLPVRKYDPELGINPPSMQKTLQQRSFQWLPDGPWSIDGKLDPQFLDWQANEWIKAYGGDIHKKRADVLRHFKKDAANVAIAWSNYSEQQIDRYRNASTRMEFGIGIKPEEQEVLLAHQRAISEPLPEEMNPVWCGDRADVLSLGGVEEAVDGCNDREITDSDFVQGQSFASVESRSIDNSQDQSCAYENRGSIDTSESQFCSCGNSGSIDNSQSQSSSPVSRRSIDTNPSLEVESPNHLPKSSAVDIPTEADGSAENPDAYRLWQPKKLEGEVVSAKEWKEKWSRLKARLSMPK